MNDLTSSHTSGTMSLPEIHLGAPTVVGPLTIFPIWTDAPVPESPVPLDAPPGATIGELEDGPSVEMLTATNPTQTPYALLEGTIVDGGWQHRVLVHSVLIAAGMAAPLPVLCIEQGRWGGEVGQQVHARHAPLGIRGAIRGIRPDAPPAPSGRDGKADQGDVWSRVSGYENTYGASSTGSLVDVLDQVDIPDQVRSSVPKPLAGQRGVLVGVAGHPAVAELFEHPDSFARQWDAMVDGLLRSTLHVPAQPTPARRARRFVRRLGGRPMERTDRAGDGVLAEATDDLVSIRTLTDADGWMIHTAVLNVRHELVLAA